jgi:hypothetical protein
MSALSRRSIVASAAALPALAVRAVVSAAPKILELRRRQLGCSAPCEREPK